jgi:hypothetical protein
MRLITEPCRWLRTGLTLREVWRPFSRAASLDVSLQLLIEGLGLVREDRPVQAMLDIYKTAAFYVLLLFCAEASFDCRPITEFWARLGLQTDSQKNAHSVESHRPCKTVPRHHAASREDLAGGAARRREEVEPTVADVAAGLPLGLPETLRQNRLRALEGLDLRLLVDAPRRRQ